MLQLVNKSWEEKLRHYTSTYKREDLNRVYTEIGQKTCDLVLSLSNGDEKAMRKAWRFYDFGEVIQERKRNIIVGFKPHNCYKNMADRKHESTFFKELCYWANMSKERKAILEEIVEPYYNHTIYEFYKYFWVDYLRNSEESFIIV